MVKIKETDELAKYVQNLRMQLSYDNLEKACAEIDNIQSVCETILERIKSAEEKRNEGRNSLTIKIDSLDKEDYERLRKNLKKRSFKLVSGVPCTVAITDKDGQNIRKLDGW